MSELTIGNSKFKTSGHTYIMGILNVTPDSFSDGGRYNTLDGLVKTLEVLDAFKRKYPNDETIRDFEDIVREEICQMFGGTTIDIE